MAIDRPAFGEKTAVVVTSISGPNKVLTEIANGCCQRGSRFWVIGDVPSPADFSLEGCSFLSLRDQLETGFRYAAICPTRHYARKNIGYLLAIRDGVSNIVETDDDNYPVADFWQPRDPMQNCPTISAGGWINVYKYFTGTQIWPRGLPLDEINTALPDLSAELPSFCPIQQGLADGNPDVDAVYRLVLPLPVTFEKKRAIALSKGSWCPFNSQNTTWFPEAFPLLYLPAYCSFRATDIWRSLIAQRICWENEWNVCFHQATVYQERNDHNLMKDFADEVPVYLQSRQIAETLNSLPLSSGMEAVPENLLRCYEALVRIGIFPPEEIPLLEAWIQDLRAAGFPRRI